MIKRTTATIRLTATILTAGVLAGALTGCVEAPARPAEPVVDVAETIVAMPGLTPTERLRRGLELLEDGDEATARAEIAMYMRESTNSRIGRSLMRQIDTPPEEYFPVEFREVILRKGQSLSNVAQTYLGGAVEFHALAKYNGIERPKRMFPGQIVKVPLTDQAKSAFSELEDALDEPSADSRPLAETLDNDLDPGNEVVVDSGQVERISTTTSVTTAVEPGAVAITSALPSATTLPPAAAPSSAAAPPSSAALSSAAALPSATTPPPAAALSSAAAPPSTAGPAPDIDVDALHRQAINAYRAQDLDTAIAIWNQVLEADPSYEGARLYRSQALALKKRLNSFN